MHDGSSKGPIALNSAQQPSRNLRPKRSASSPIGVCRDDVAGHEHGDEQQGRSLADARVQAEERQQSEIRRLDQARDRGRKHDHRSRTHGAHETAERRTALAARSLTLRSTASGSKRQQQARGADDERPPTARPRQFAAGSDRR